MTIRELGNGLIAQFTATAQKDNSDYPSLNQAYVKRFNNTLDEFTAYGLAEHLEDEYSRCCAMIEEEWVELAKPFWPAKSLHQITKICDVLRTLIEIEITNLQEFSDALECKHKEF